MSSPQGFILYRIYYGNRIFYVGRTKQPLQARIRGHMFAKPMHKSINIHNVSKIEYTMLQSAADMYLYEIYYINLWKPDLNIDDKAKDKLTFTLPEHKWTEFIPANWDSWKDQISIDSLRGWKKYRDKRLANKYIND